MGYKIRDLSNKSSAAEPVRFLSTKERFLFFVEENRALVWGGIFLAIAVVVAVILLNWLSQQKQEQAWELQGQAQQVYMDRSLEDVKQSQENVQKATGLFQEIVKEYPGTESAEVSLYLLGNSFMESQKYQEAIEVYTSFLSQYTEDPIFTALVQQRLGLAYLLTGNREAGINAFEAVLANPQALNKDQVMFEMAKLAEADEQIEEAVGYYKRIVQEFPLSPFASESELRIKVLAPEEASPPESKEPGEEPGEKNAESQPVQGEGETQE